MSKLKPMLPSMRVDDQVALITGAGRGIGRASAFAFAEAGADVILVSRTEAEITAVAEGVRQRGRRATAIPCDVTDTKAVRRLFAGLEHIDVLVNNAGLYRVSPLWETTEEDLDEIIGVNLKGSFAMAHHAARAMIPSRQGCIINVTSGA